MKHLWLILVAISLVVPAAAWSGPGGGPANSHASPASTPSQDLEGLPMMVGFFERQFRSIAIDGVVYSGVLAGGPYSWSGGRDLRADTLDGAPLWRTMLVPEDTPYLDGSHRLGSPVADGDDLFIQDSTGRVWSVSLRTGEIQWSTSIPGGIPGHRIFVEDHGIGVSEDRVIAVVDLDADPNRQDFGLRAYDRATGAIIWTDERGESNTLMAMADQLVVTSGAGRVEARDVSNGALVWQYELADPSISSWHTGGPGFHDGKIFITQIAGRGSGDGWEEQQILHAIHLDGTRAWKFSLPWSSPDSEYAVGGFGPALANGTAYVHFGDEVIALETGLGAVLWRRDVGVAASHPIVAGRDVIFSTRPVADWDSATISAVDAVSGASRWPGPVFSSIRDVQMDGEHILVQGSYWRHEQGGTGLHILHKDTTPPQWPSTKPLQGHQQSHAWRLVWERPIDHNPHSVLVQGATTDSGRWQDLAVTYAEDYAGGWLYDPYLSFEQNATHPDYIRVIPIDAAGNRGPSSNVWARPPEPSPQPTFDGGGSSGTHQAWFTISPQSVQVGGELTAKIVVEASDAEAPSSVEATIQFDDTTVSTFTLEIDGKDTQWSAHGSTGFEAPVRPGDYEYVMTVRGLYGDGWKPLVGATQPVQVVGEEPMPTRPTYPAPRPINSSSDDFYFASELVLDDQTDGRVHAEVTVGNGGYEGGSASVMFWDAETQRSIAHQVGFVAAGERRVFTASFQPTQSSHVVRAILQQPTNDSVEATWPTSGASGASIVLSVGITNIGNLGPNETRTIPVEVTAYNADAHSVRLIIVESGGLDVRSITPVTDISQGTTLRFYLEARGVELAENVTAENRKILVQAVSQDANSNVEAINLLTMDTPDGFQIPTPGFGYAAAALGAGGLLASGFRRRDTGR